MAQFIRKASDIDVISSCSRPVSTASLQKCIETSSSASIEEDNHNLNTISPSSGNLQTIKFDQYCYNPSLPSLIYDNYTLLPSKVKVNHYQQQQQQQSEDPISPDLTSRSFQTALDTHHPQTSGYLTNAGTFELQTQDPTQPNDEYFNSTQAITPLPNQLNPVVTVSILTRLFRFLRYLVGLNDNRQQFDPERQPLLSPINSPISPISNQGEQPLSPSRQGPAYDLFNRYRYVFIVSTVLIAAFLITVVLVTGDSKLLVIIGKALLCYLLGSNAQYLLGEDFCPA